MSSFRRASSGPAPPVPRGTKPLSSAPSQLLTSWGVHSLDEILGGGLPLGSITLLMEDKVTSYAQVLNKYFIAQGLVAGHDLILVSADERPSGILDSLMGVVQGRVEEELESDDGDQPSGGPVPGSSSRVLGQIRRGGQDDRMKIAWRYQNLPKVNSVLGANAEIRKSSKNQVYCSTFDLTKTFDRDTLSKNQAIHLLDTASLNSGDPYSDLLHKITAIVSSPQYSTSPSNVLPNVLRIALPAFGSPFWGSACPQQTIHQSRFLYALRSIIRSSLCVCLFSTPSYLYSANLVLPMENLADAVFQVHSFTLAKDKALMSEYHGFLYPLKLPSLSTLYPPSNLKQVELRSLAFKVRRKRFLVEVFELPPELGDNDESQASPEIGATGDGENSEGSKKKQHAKGGCGITVDSGTEEW